MKYNNYIVKFACLLFLFSSIIFYSCSKDENNNNFIYEDNYNLAIGDIGPAGGYVFYVNPNANMDRWKYMEAAPSDTELTHMQWGDVEVIVGGTKSNIGSGADNTQKIVDKLADYNEGNYAAFICHNLIVNNNNTVYDDWFLPSKDELNLIYDNLYDNTPSLGGFSEFNFYWSSTEFEYDSCAWGQLFYDGSDVEEYPFPPGYQSPSQKDSSADIYSVRAVRVF
jgi:hypothetical protein